MPPYRLQEEEFWKVVPPSFPVWRTRTTVPTPNPNCPSILPIVQPHLSQPYHRFPVEDAPWPGGRQA